MKSIYTHVLARPLSVFLAFLMAIMSGWLTFGTSNVVKAQQSNGNPTWAVLDFQNDTGYGGSEVGREMSDALDVELYNSNRTEVVKRSDIYGDQGAIKQLGLSEPFDIVDLQKIGRFLDARAVVTGEVLSIAKTDKPRTIQVTVAVRAMDVASGELINGALAQGVGYPRSDSESDDDAVVGEAIRKAAFAATAQMSKFDLPIATVLNYDGPDNLLVNKGSRDGMHPGLNMLVLRNGQEIGHIRLTNVDQDSSTASIPDPGLGIRPQDRCRALFSMPSYTVHDNRVYTTSVIANGSAQNSVKKNQFSGPGGLLLALLAGALFLTLVNRGNSTGSLGGGYIGGVTSEAVAEGAANGSNNASNVGVHVHWGYGNLNPRSIISFNIYRDNFHPNKGNGVNGTGTAGTTTTTTGTTGTTSGVIDNPDGPVLTAGNGQFDAVDNEVARSFSYNFSDLTQTTSGTTAGTTTVGTTTSGTTTSGTTSGTTGTTNGGTTTNGTTSNGTTSGTSSGTGATSAGVTIGTLNTSTQTVSGVQNGVPHTYYVTAVYTVTDEVSGITGAEETPLSSGTAQGFATPLFPVDVLDTTSVFINGAGASNANGVNLTSVVFSFLSVAGADSYVIDVAPDITYSKKIVLTPAQSHTINGGETVSTNNVNLTTQFPGVTHFVFRIGARDSADKPGPSKNPMYQGNISNPDLNPNGGSYIYSPNAIFNGVL